MLSSHLRQSSFINYNMSVTGKVPRTNCKAACSKASICCFSANRLAFEVRRGARDFDPFLDFFFWPEGPGMGPMREGKLLGRVNGVLQGLHTLRDFGPLQPRSYSHWRVDPGLLDT